MTSFTLPAITALSATIVVATLALVWCVRRPGTPRQRAFTRLLDAADALEARLHTAKAEIEAITGDEDESVRAALQEMLRQRLWLQQHGETASTQTLDGLRASIEEARSRIDQQLIQVKRARSAAT